MASEQAYVLKPTQLHGIDRMTVSSYDYFDWASDGVGVLASLGLTQF